MRQSIIFFVLIFELVSVADGMEDTASSPSQFEIDKDLVERIYRESATSTGTVHSRPGGGIAIDPELSIFFPSEMNLSNGYFEVPYASGFVSMLVLTVLASGRVLHLGPVAFKAQGGVSYTFKEGTLRVLSKTTTVNRERNALMRLHSLPIFLGAQIEYEGFAPIQPFIVGRAGAQWLYQSGNLDGIEQGFWIPFYQVGVGLTLFDSTHTQSDAWFSGLTLSALRHLSLSSDQVVQGWNLNLGISILL